MKKRILIVEESEKWRERWHREWPKELRNSKTLKKSGIVFQIVASTEEGIDAVSQGIIIVVIAIGDCKYSERFTPITFSKMLAQHFIQAHIITVASSGGLRNLMQYNGGCSGESSRLHLVRLIIDLLDKPRPRALPQRPLSRKTFDPDIQLF